MRMYKNHYGNILKESRGLKTNECQINQGLPDYARLLLKNVLAKMELL